MDEKPGLFRTWHGCFTMFLWALAFWGAFTIIVLSIWRW